MQELELAAELFGGAAGGSAANAEDLDTGLNEGHTLDIETPELDGPAEAEARQGDASVSGRGGAGKGAGKRKPAWVDDDVAELKANVVRKKTLRKLRKEEDEEEITGNEFENRLRQHHAKMHRAPQVSDAERPERIIASNL